MKAALNALDDRLAKFELPANPSTEAVGQEFSIPNSLPNRPDTWGQLCDWAAHFVVGTADELFPRGSWPWTLTREYCFDRFADGAADDSEEIQHTLSSREYERFERGSDFGPLSAYLFVKLIDRVNSPTEPSVTGEDDVHADADRGDYFTGLFANAGLRDLSDAAVLRDVRLVSDGDFAFGKLCQHAAEQFVVLTDEEQEQLLAVLPGTCRAPLRLLALRRKDKPNESIGDAMDRVLVDCWHDWLREEVEAELRSHADRVAQRPRRRNSCSSIVRR